MVLLLLAQSQTVWRLRNTSVLPIGRTAGTESSYVNCFGKARLVKSNGFLCSRTSPNLRCWSTLRKPCTVPSQKGVSSVALKKRGACNEEDFEGAEMGANVDHHPLEESWGSWEGRRLGEMVGAFRILQDWNEGRGPGDLGLESVVKGLQEMRVRTSWGAE